MLARRALDTTLLGGGLAAALLLGMLTARLVTPVFERPIALVAVAPPPIEKPPLGGVGLSRAFGVHAETALDVAPPPPQRPAWLLRAAIVSTESPLSSALLSDSRVLFVGDHVQGYVVRSIERAPLRLTLVDASGRLEHLGPGARSAAASARSDDRFTVRRADVESIVANPAQALSWARLAPSGGGYRIFSIRSDSPLGALGLQDGDVLRTLDGAPIEPARVFALLARLRDVRQVTVGLDRGGTPLARTLSIE